MDGGKGSKPRPYSVSQDEYSKRWDAIFKRNTASDRRAMEDAENLDNAFSEAEKWNKLREQFRRD